MLGWNPSQLPQPSALHSGLKASDKAARLRAWGELHSLSHQGCEQMGSGGLRQAGRQILEAPKGLSQVEAGAF